MSMRKKHKGSISNALIAAVLLFSLVMWVYGATKSEPADVKSVIALASGSEAATLILKAGLKSTPTPTVLELSKLRGAIEEQLVLEQARQLTGDKSLRAASVVEAEKKAEGQAQEAKGQAQIEAFFNNPPIKWLFYAAIILGLFFGGFKFYRSMLTR